MYIVTAEYDVRKSIGCWSTDVICVSTDLTKCATAIENDDRTYALEMFDDPNQSMKVLFEKDVWYHAPNANKLDLLHQSYTIYDVVHETKIESGRIEYRVFEREVV